MDVIVSHTYPCSFLILCVVLLDEIKEVDWGERKESRRRRTNYEKKNQFDGSEEKVVQKNLGTLVRITQKEE